jgi:transposase
MDEGNKQTQTPPGWQPKTGRRIKLTRELLHEITARLAGGLYFDTACRLCSVSPSSGYGWLARGRALAEQYPDDLPEQAEESLFLEFLEAVENAKAEAEARSVLGIREAGKTDWRAHAWYLERTQGDKYAPKERHVHEFAKSSDERLVAEAARLIGGDFAQALGQALGVSSEASTDADGS